MHVIYCSPRCHRFARALRPVSFIGSLDAPSCFLCASSLLLNAPSLLSYAPFRSSSRASFNGKQGSQFSLPVCTASFGIESQGLPSASLRNHRSNSYVTYYLPRALVRPLLSLFRALKTACDPSRSVIHYIQIIIALQSFHHLPKILFVFEIATQKSILMNQDHNQHLYDIYRKIEFEQYFQRELNIHVYDSDLVEADKAALRLGSFKEILERSFLCPFCRLIVTAICRRRTTWVFGFEDIIARNNGKRTEMKC